MGKKERLFQFKQFAVNHSRSAMKVGVDSVLLGSWAGVEGAGMILDAGTGCGLLALMAAQRNPTARILGVEIDSAAADEASGNFASSPWGSRLESICMDFGLFASLEKNRKVFDLIISNPPYFSSGLSPVDARTAARHQGEFSPYAILAAARSLLRDGGSVSMVLPEGEIFNHVSEKATDCGLYLARICRVRGRSDLPVKRVLAEWRLLENAETRRVAPGLEESELVLEIEPGIPTPAHRSLCRDFYLRF